MIRRITISLVGVSAIAAAACSELVGPDSRRAALTVSSKVTGYFTGVIDSTNWQFAQCDVELTVKATGKGSATLSKVTDTWYWGKDRLKPADSDALDGQELIDAWKKGPVQAGDSLVSYWRFYGPFPFELELGFAYGLPGEQSPPVTSTRFVCGPTPPPALSLPAVTRLELIRSPGPFEPGQSYSVSYDASNTGGLWATIVWATGAFPAQKNVPEGMKTATTLNVPMGIPIGSPLGIASKVSVFSYDQFEQFTSMTVDVEPLVDVSPPYLNLLQFHNFDATRYEPGGIYFVGESVTMRVYALDNHRVTSVVRSGSPNGPRDSLVGNSPELANEQVVTFGPEWLGMDAMSITARDASGNTKTLTSAPGAFRVAPTVLRPMWAVTLPGVIEDFAVDTLRDMVYLAQLNQERAAFFSLASKGITATVAGKSRGLDISPDGSTLLVAAGDSLTRIDLTQTPPVVTQIPLSVAGAVHANARSVRVAANGKAFVRMEGDGTAAYRLLDINLGTGVQQLRADGAANAFAGGLGRSHDHSTLVVNRGSCNQRYDSGTDSFGACGEIIPKDWVPAVDGAGNHFSVGVKVYDGNVAFLRAVQSSQDYSNSTPIATIDPAGEFLYHFVGPTGILKSRVSDGLLIERIVWPNFIPSDMRVSPDGKRLILIQDGYSSTAKIGAVDLTTTLP